jgi:hypothetical protein
MYISRNEATVALGITTFNIKQPSTTLRHLLDWTNRTSQYEVRPASLGARCLCLCSVLGGYHPRFHFTSTNS